MGEGGPIVLFEAFVVVLEALFKGVDGGLGPFAGDEDLNFDGGFLAGVDHFLARAIGFVAHLDALDGMSSRPEAWDAQRGGFRGDAGALAIDEDFDLVAIGFENEGAEFGGGGSGRLGVSGRIGEEHFGVEGSAIRARGLLAAGGFADVPAGVFGEFRGGDDAVAVFIGFAFHALDDVIGEDAVTAAEVGGFKAPFVVAGGGERKEAGVQALEDGVEIRGAGFGGHETGVAAIREQDLVFRFQCGTDQLGEAFHGVTRGGDVARMEIMGSQIPFALVHEAVPGEVDENAVVFAGDGGKPGLEFALDVLASGAGAG